MPGPALARDLLAGGHVDHVDREIGQLGREGGGEIVAARFDEHDLELGPLAHDVGHGREVDRGILADRGVRAAAGLDADDALGLERPGAGQELGVFLGVDVVGDDGDVVVAAHLLAQPLDQRGLARPDRAADTDAQGTAQIHHCISRVSSAMKPTPRARQSGE